MRSADGPRSVVNGVGKAAVQNKIRDVVRLQAQSVRGKRRAKTVGTRKAATRNISS